MPWPKGVANDALTKWTAEQEDYVRDNYNGNGSNLAEVLPFTASAIRNKAKRLGQRNWSHFHNVVPTPMPNIDPLDLSYIAAFVDGEGSIYPHQKAYRVSMANSDEPVIRWIHSKIGIGKVRIFEPRQKQHHRSYVLDIFAHGDVWGFLMLLHPYMKVKRLRAESVIEYFNMKYKKIPINSGG